MYMIAGLGNPGRKYEGTRHNIGFDVIAILERTCGISVMALKNKALTGTGMVGGQKAMLIKPQTFMNLSGDALQGLLAFYKEDPSESLIVISDDIDLPAGRIRIRKSGSPGGHNGLKDIVQKIGTQQFIRVRVGIGQKPAGWDLADYVLSHFGTEDRKRVDEAEAAAAEAVITILRDGVDAAMNKYNSFLPEKDRIAAEEEAARKREEAARRRAEREAQRAEQVAATEGSLSEAPPQDE